MKVKIDETLSDLAIIKEVISGKKHLYEQIIHRYNSYLYRVGKSYGYEHDDVEDLMQETYVNAYLNLKNFEGRASFKTWLVKIMVNQCFHKGKKLSFRNEKADSETINNESLNQQKMNHSDGNKTVQNNELNQVIEKAILKIPEDYRVVFSMRELNGMTTSQTAKALNISDANVKTRLFRAKSLLQNEITKTYSRSEIFEFNLKYCDKMVARVMKAIENL